eukprot:CAMPEP_0119394216 /NCGR_PEP_ID=MMETSP1334-20130426/128402_1 /TAXON_ID=127549 /ORGANISM="Calcidiscus leptoporus, Strain RCC1130" /LENGTH=94 /DNA_ID=CAMNT_0007417429 /DNA_START=90 /DNA_END=371 /DNA_ORIENTATION=-
MPTRHTHALDAYTLEEAGKLLNRSRLAQDLVEAGFHRFRAALQVQAVGSQRHQVGWRADSSAFNCSQLPCDCDAVREWHLHIEDHKTKVSAQQQ